VLPNTAEFAAKLKAAVKGMNEDVQVGVDLDTGSARAQLAELTRKSRMRISVNADTALAEAQVEKLAERKQIVIQAQALTAKAAAELDALTNRRRNLNIRVSAITAQAAAQLAAIDKDRDVRVDAHLNDASIKKAEARIQALDRKRDLVLSLDTKQVTKRYNRLKAQMRHLTSQLNLKTDPKDLAKLRAQLDAVGKGFKVVGDIKLNGRAKVLADIEALKRRYTLVIDSRTKHLDRDLAKIRAEMQAIQDKRNVTLSAVFNGAKAKGEYEAWEASIKKQLVKVSIALNTAEATADWETYKNLLESYRMEFDTALNTARASVDADRLKTKIEAMRLRINAQLDATKVEGELRILTRDYRLELEAHINDKIAKVSLANLARNRDVYFKAILETKKANAQFAALEHRRIASIHVELEDSLRVQAEMMKLGRSRDVEFKAELSKSSKLEAELAWLTRDRTVHVKLKNDLRTKLFNKFNRKLRETDGIIGRLGTSFTGLGRLIGGGMAMGIGKAINAMGKFGGSAGTMGDSMVELGSTAVKSVTGSLGTFISSALISALAIGGIVAIAGVLIAVFAGLAAAILAVVAALLGMVLALVMLAAALVGALIGVAALAALPLLFIGGALALRSENKRLMKSFSQLGKTFKKVMSESFEPMVKAFETEIPKMQKWLKTMQPSFKKAFEAASKHLESFRLGIQGFVENLVPKLTTAMNSKPFENFMKSFSKALGVIGGAIGDTFIELAKNGDKFAVVISEIARGLGEVLPSFASFLGSLATGAKSTGLIADGVAGMFDELAASFNRALATDGWKETVTGISDMMKKFGDAIGTGFEVAMEHGDDFGKAFSALGDFFEGISGPLAEFTASAAGQFADVMPSVTAGFQEIIPAMQRFTESFAKFAPDVVREISDAIAELFDYLARPDVAEKCAEITKAFVKLAKTVLGPETLDAVLSITQTVLDLANIFAPLLPLLIQFFMISLGFKAAGALASVFGGKILKVGEVLSGANGKTGKLGTALKGLGTKFKTLGTVLKGGMMKTLTAIGTKAVKIGPKLASVGTTFLRASATFAKGGARMIATLAKVLLRTIIFAARMALQWIIAMGPIFWIGLLVAGLVALIIIYWDQIVAAAKVAWEYIYTNVIQPLIELCKIAWQGFVDFMSGIWDGIKAGASACWEAIKFIFQVAMEACVGWILGLVRGAMAAWSNIKTGASVAWSSIKTYIGGVIESVKGKFSEFKGNISSGWNSIKTTASGAWNNIRSAFSGAMQDIKGACSDMVAWVVGKFNDLKSRATSALSNLNPANWFSATIDLDVNANVPTLKGMTAPLTLSAPVMDTFASLAKENPWRDDAQVLASGFSKADSTFNNSLAIAGALHSSDSGSSTVSSRGRGGSSVVVNAQTNANPFEIGKEVAWALRRK
jgi:hypothetical protein